MNQIIFVMLISIALALSSCTKEGTYKEVLAKDAAISDELIIEISKRALADSGFNVEVLKEEVNWNGTIYPNAVRRNTQEPDKSFTTYWQNPAAKDDAQKRLSVHLERIGQSVICEVHHSL